MDGGERTYLGPLLKEFRATVLGKIKPADIRAAAVKLYPDAAPATRNRQVIVPARAVINHGHERGWCAPIRVKMFPVPKSRKHKPVTEEWLSAFLAQSDKDGLPHLAALVLFLNRTGVRVSEALRLTGEFIDLGKRVALLEWTKEGEWETAHLTSDVIVRLAALGLQDGVSVFGYSDYPAANKRIKAVCARAGIEPRSTHGAGRHSYATNAMALPGARVKDVMDGGRWKSAKLFMETYVHSDEGGRSVAEQMDRKIGPIATNQPGSTKRRRIHFGKKRVK